MKNLCKTLLKALIIAIIGTQFAAFIMDKLSLGMPWGKATMLIIYTVLMTAVFIFDMIIERKPGFPSAKLNAILDEEGYSPRFYKTVSLWREKCAAKGYVNYPSLVMSELLIDGGHYNEGFEILSALDFESLSRTEKQVYFNTYLYGAVLCGDRAQADKIYESGRLYLISVTSASLVCSVKHTLGCYEYLRGNLHKAEELFTQSLGGSKLTDIICEDHLGLSACYLDTDRLPQAKKAVETAAKYADSAPLRAKLERAKRLVETAYSQKISESEKTSSAS